LRRGIGFSLLTRSGFDADLRDSEVEALPFRPRAFWRLMLVKPANARRSDVAEAFMRTVREVARELSRSGLWAGRSLDRLPSRG
jgi:DNA-binding transcriptional LysR family regulator